MKYQDPAILQAIRETDKVIKDYEEAFEMSSSFMERQVEEGVIDEDLAICQWLLALRYKETLVVLRDGKKLRK